MRFLHPDMRFYSGTPTAKRQRAPVEEAVEAGLELPVVAPLPALFSGARLSGLIQMYKSRALSHRSRLP